MKIRDFTDFALKSLDRGAGRPQLLQVRGPRLPAADHGALLGGAGDHLVHHLGYADTQRTPVLDFVRQSMYILSSDQ